MQHTVHHTGHAHCVPLVPVILSPRLALWWSLMPSARAAPLLTDTVLAHLLFIWSRGTIAYFDLKGTLPTIIISGRKSTAFPTASCQREVTSFIVLKCHFNLRGQNCIHNVAYSRKVDIKPFATCLFLLKIKPLLNLGRSETVMSLTSPVCFCICLLYIWQHTPPELS